MEYDKEIYELLNQYNNESVNEKTLLNKLYNDFRLSLKQIAILLNTNPPTIRRRLIRYSLPLRPIGRRLKELEPNDNLKRLISKIEGE